jgi:hypothetical protein
MRDSAIDGLSVLARRSDWSCADDAVSIRARVVDALDDENPLVRMHAAEAFGALYASLDAPQRVQALGDRLMNEQDITVQNVLLRALASEMTTVPQGVDDVLKHLVDRLETSTGEKEDDNDDDRVLMVDILTILAIKERTPFALNVIEKWVRSAPQYSTESLRVIQNLRNFVEPQINSDLQARAFELLAIAADVALAVANRPADEQFDRADVSAEDTTEADDALRILDRISDQIYFASGAFNKEDDGATVGLSHESFAVQAFPVLSTCAQTGIAVILHHVVETLIYLSPLNEKRALVAVANAVGVNIRYASDSLAGYRVIPYLKRLLAENRELVLFDAEGVTAFRQLLSTFATAGNQHALEMAFTFAEVFR